MTRTTMSTKEDFSTSEFRLKSRAEETLLTTLSKFSRSETISGTLHGDWIRVE